MVGSGRFLRADAHVRESGKIDEKHLNYLVVGPWNHGGWAGGAGNSLGEIPFGCDTGVYFRQKVEAPWFAYWLHDKGNVADERSVAISNRKRHLDEF